MSLIVIFGHLLLLSCLAGVGLIDWLMGVVGRAMPWRGSGFTDQL
jgi:hypothetical protein